MAPPPTPNFMLAIEHIMVNIFRARSPIPFEHVTFWCPFLISHLTIYTLKSRCSIKSIARLRSICIFKILTCTPLAVRCDLGLPHLVSNCDSWWLLFQVSKLESRCKTYKRLKWRLFSLFKGSNRSSWSCLKLNLKWCYYVEHIVQS